MSHPDAQQAALRLWWSLCYEAGDFERMSTEPTLDPSAGLYYEVYEIPVDGSGPLDYQHVAVYGPPECPEMVVLED